MPKNNDIHLFLAETTSRKKDLSEEIKKYNKIFNRDVLNDYRLFFHCYQTAYKWKNENFGLVIADEIHDSLSPAYSKFYFNNNYKAIIGLSATIEKNTWYEENDKKYSKGQLLEKIAPICYKYNLKTAHEEGTTRKLEINIIYNELDDIHSYIESGNKNKKFYQTEKKAYEYWDKEHKKSYWIEDEEFKKVKLRITSYKRSHILYNLKSKILIVRLILSNITGKSIIFGNSINHLERLTPNVISSNNSEDENKRIREDFDNNKIQVIGSFKKLKQGANLEDLDNCIIVSYYSVEKDLIQRIGRLRDNGKLGKVFIIVTKFTKEEDWFKKMFENTDFKFNYYNNITEYINGKY